MDHISSIYEDKIAMYEARDDMERLPRLALLTRTRGNGHATVQRVK